MDVEKHTSLLVDTLKNFLNAANIEGTVESEPLNEKKVRIKINVNDGSQGYIIGKEGSTLVALQHIISLLARKEQSEVQYQIDINDYQSERDQVFLKRVSDYVAEKAESTELLLWPMSAYERRLVHEYFLREGSHSTASEDFGAKRVVRVIKK